MVAGVLKTVRPHPSRRDHVIVTGTWMMGLPVPEKCPRRLEHVRSDQPSKVLGIWVLRSVNTTSEEVTLWKERSDTQLCAGDMLQWRASSGKIPLWGNSSKPPPNRSNQ